jgi:hypothetical protein
MGMHTKRQACEYYSPSAGLGVRSLRDETRQDYAGCKTDRIGGFRRLGESPPKTIMIP